MEILCAVAEHQQKFQSVLNLFHPDHLDFQNDMEYAFGKECWNWNNSLDPELSDPDLQDECHIFPNVITAFSEDFIKGAFSEYY